MYIHVHIWITQWIYSLSRDTFRSSCALFLPSALRQLKVTEMMLKTYFPFICPRLSTPEDAQFFGPAVQLFVNRLCDALSPYILRRDSRLIASSNMSGLYVTLSITTHDIHTERERVRERTSEYVYIISDAWIYIHRACSWSIQRKVYKVHDLLLHNIYVHHLDTCRST